MVELFKNGGGTVNEDELLQRIFFGYANNSFEKLAKDNTKFVHYTSAETGLKILKDETIWMRNVRCMNDYSEIKWGREVVEKALEDEEIKMKFNKLYAELLPRSGNVETFESLFKLPKITFLDDVEKRTYITCLSEHHASDNKYGKLSMWRAYGRNDGIALIMNTKFINEEGQVKDCIFSVSPVLYTDDIKEELNKIITRMSENLEELKKISFARIRSKLFHAIYFAILSIKHPAFCEEREWRIILSFFDKKETAQLKDVIQDDYVTIGGVPQKIYKIKLNNKTMQNTKISELLDGIIVGPTDNPDVIKEAFEGVLREKGISLKENRIHVSKVPLRR